MSYIGSQVKMLFGGPGDDFGRASGGSNHQLIQEQITATTGRAQKGSQNSSNAYSLHVIVGTGSAPVGTLSVWYSNLPNPDPANDAHWVQDANAFGTGVPTLDLSVVANTFRTNTVVTDSVRVKVTRTSGTISLVVWMKAIEST